jgi:hypothetical protein
MKDLRSDTIPLSEKIWIVQLDYEITKYVDDYELLKALVDDDYYALKFIKHPTVELCNIAVSNNLSANIYVPDYLIYEITRPNELSDK